MHYEEEVEKDFLTDAFLVTMLALFVGSIMFGLIKLSNVKAVIKGEPNPILVIRKYNFNNVKPAFMEKKMALTKKQRDVLGFIRDYKQKHKVSPTLREIQDNFKLKSQSSVQEYLRYLQSYGAIQVKKGSIRGIILREECPTCGRFQ